MAPGMAALWEALSESACPGEAKFTPSSPEVVTLIWLKFAVTLFAQAFGVVAVPALAGLAGRAKSAATANASVVSADLRRFDMSHTPFAICFALSRDLGVPPATRSRRNSGWRWRSGG